jgi:uncharacterized repeat protein (TIGR01451 family)
MAGLRGSVAFALFSMASVLPVWGQNYVKGAGMGAESRLDNTPRNVSFPLTVTGTTGTTYSLAGGIFYMKDGPGTTGNVTLSVINSAAVTLGSITLSNSQFCGNATGSACQSYFFHTFTFPSPLTLSPGSYTLVLSTNAIPQQNMAYFVKGGGTSFSVAAGGPPPPPILSVTKIASPANFTSGGQAAYTVEVVNAGSATSGTITVTDTLDPNLTYVSAISSIWGCSAAAQVVTCTTSAVIAEGASAPPIIITANVAAHGETSVTNNVAVSGGGSSSNSSQLITPVSAANLSISKSATPPTFTQGQNGAIYTIMVPGLCTRSAFRALVHSADAVCD